MLRIGDGVITPPWFDKRRHQNWVVMQDSDADHPRALDGGHCVQVSAELGDSLHVYIAAMCLDVLLWT
jgi:hypothetical protein